MNFDELNKERVMISICEIFQNNNISGIPVEIPDFRRNWDSTDELFKNPIFPKKNIYSNPSNVEAFLLSFPVDTQKELLENIRGLYTILFLHYGKAVNAVERFEESYGKIDEFFKGVPSQIAAFTLYTFKRTGCIARSDELQLLTDKKWQQVLKSDQNFNLEFDKGDYEKYRSIISDRFDERLNGKRKSKIKLT